MLFCGLTFLWITVFPLSEVFHSSQIGQCHSKDPKVLNFRDQRKKTSEKQESHTRCVISNTLTLHASGQAPISDSNQSFHRCSVRTSRYFPLHSLFLAINEGGSVSKGLTLLARGGETLVSSARTVQKISAK